MGNGIRVGSGVFTEDWGTKKKKLTPEEAEVAREKKKAYMKEYLKKYYTAHRDEKRIRDRRYAKKRKLSELIPGYVPLNAAKPSPPPPCGGDCENCPWDSCKYPEEDEDIYIDPDGYHHRRETRRKCDRDSRARRKERRKEDPEFDKMCKAKQVRYARKYREKCKFVKAGGTPEGFEDLWAEAGGDPEEYKKLMKGKGE